MDAPHKYNFKSFTRGYHAYSTIWKPVIGDVLTLVHDATDEYPERVALRTSNNIVVGHVPLYLCKWIYRFLKRTNNIGKATVIQDKVNRGAGLGLEIPVLYTLSSDDTFSINWVQTKICAEQKYLQ